MAEVLYETNCRECGREHKPDEGMPDCPECHLCFWCATPACVTCSGGPGFDHD
jgi:hypothetical protein